MNRNEYDYYESGSPNIRLMVLLVLGILLILVAAVNAGTGNGNDNGNGNSNGNAFANGHDKDTGNNDGSSNGSSNNQGPKHQILRVEMVNSLALLTCRGEAGTNYCIEATTCLEEPVCWAPICTNGPASGSQFQYLDTCSSNYPCRFYRLVTEAEAAQHSNNGKQKGKGNNNGNHNGDINGHPNGNDQGNGNDNNIGSN